MDAEITAGEGQEQHTETPQESENEVKARRLGWVPKEQFKGDTEHWRSAEEFLEWSAQGVPSLRRDRDRLQRQISDLEKLAKENAETFAEFREFASKSEQRAYERAKAEIQQRIEKGAADADANAVRAGMAELDELNKAAPKAAPQKTEKRDDQPKVDPVIQDWMDRETWYLRDRTLNAFATDVFGDLERNKPGMSTEERLAETKRLTKDKFPEKFGINPARNGAAKVDEPSGGNSSGRPKPKTYEALPPEAKAACDRQVRVLGITREEYVKHYDWEG